MIKKDRERDCQHVEGGRGEREGGREGVREEGR